MTALVRNCDHVAIVDGHIAQMVLRAKPRRWSYLRNLPERSFLRTMRSKQERTRNLVYGYIGGVSLERNVHSMLEGWKAFAKRRPDCRLRIVGILGGNQKYFTQRIQPLLNELRSTVQYRGPIPYEQVPDFFRSIDVSVTPSRDDHLPLRVGESLASRVPTIMRWGPYRKSIFGDKGIVYFEGGKPGESDQSADSKDARALSEAYEQALDHIDALRRDVWAREILTWEDDVRRLVDVYEAISKKRGH
jgi:glycosyltransferase involved in cell wall biosynthesis